MKITSPTGLNDLLPGQAEALQACQQEVQECLRSFGYQTVETPALEFLDLFLAKAGQLPGVRLFTLDQGGRRLCLRPEFTASLGRLFVEKMQQWPQPIRLQVSGPVFRLESPQRGRSRQFTMAGVELIGAGGALADAETIAVAGAALRAISDRPYRIIVGHVGLVRDILENLNLSPRGAQFVLRHMESLRKPSQGRDHVNRTIDRLYPPTGEEEPPSEEPPNPRSGHVTDAVSDMLSSQDGFLGSRTADEIARRLADKLQTSSERDGIHSALDAIEALHSLAGPAKTALRKARAYLQERGWSDTSLASLEATLDLVAAHGIPEESLWLDLGMGRGLHYYTGMVFEIHRIDEQRGDSQLCGGGRYDNLLQDLGSRQEVPAVGFALGLERALDWRIDGMADEKDQTREADVLVAPVEPDDTIYAISAAQRLRQETGLRVELQLKEALSLGQCLSQADRRGIPVVVIVGATERQGNQAILRHMASRAQESIALDGLAGAVVQAVNNEERGG
jgi:histidyl-tRNA synthetase